MLVKLAHSEKAPSPIFITEYGITILFRLLHPSKAHSPIIVTGYPLIDETIVTSSTISLSYPPTPNSLLIYTYLIPLIVTISPSKYNLLSPDNELFEELLLDDE